MILDSNISLRPYFVFAGVKNILVRMCVHVRVSVCTCTRVCVYMYACLCVHVRVSVCTCTRVCVWLCVLLLWASCHTQDHLDLMNKNGDRIGYYGYSDAVYSFVSELCMRSGDKNRYPASDAVVAEELAATQHPDLVPCLRGYQQRAVRWMLHQECDSPHAKGSFHCV